LLQFNPYVSVFGVIDVLIGFALSQEGDNPARPISQKVTSNGGILQGKVYYSPDSELHKNRFSATCFMKY